MTAVGVALGGDVQVMAVQARYAVTDRLGHHRHEGRLHRSSSPTTRSRINTAGAIWRRV